MEMKLINAYGDVTTRRMLSQVLEGTNEGDLSLATFEWPADVKRHQDAYAHDEIDRR